MLAALPEEVRAIVISFLVPFLHRQGHGCPVIATGVASRKHRVWKIAGYHWWNLRADQFVEDTIVRINARLLLRAFEGWFIRTVGPRVDKFSELLWRCNSLLQGNGAKFSGGAVRQLIGHVLFPFGSLITERKLLEKRNTCK